MTLLLLCSGVVFAQPSWGEGESFDDLRDEWNGWVEALPADDRVFSALIELLERMRDERYDTVNHETGAHAIDVLTTCRPWNEYWAYREAVLGAYTSELDELASIATRTHFAAPIPRAVDVSELDQDAAYLPSFWFERYSLNTNGPIRDAVQYLISDAVYHAFEGRPEVAIKRFEAAAKMCAFTLELPTELGYMTEIAVRAVVREAISASVQYGPDVFDDAQLMRLQRLLVHDLSTNFDGVWRLEQRIAQADLRLHFYSLELARTNRELRAYFFENAKVYGSFGMFSAYLAKFDSPDPSADIPLGKLSDQVSVQARITDAMVRDFSTNAAMQGDPEICKAIKKYLSGRDANRYIPVYIDVALWRLQLGFFHRENYDTANQIAALSIYRHRARHGQWPESLAGIDPEVLPIPAIDYYSGEPLRYTLVHGEPRLWALGIDRDDDGGRHVDEPSQFMRAVRDWVSHAEWDRLGEDVQSQLDGDIRILD